MRTRIKICGITRIDDGMSAALLGADAIGLVFWSGSPRAVTGDHGRRIALAMPPFVSRVGLFVDPTADDVEAVLDRVPLDVLQFHGQESDQFCGGFGRPYLKAIRVADDATPRHLLECARRFPGAQGILLDALRPGALPGGTGEVFDWSLVPSDVGKPLILSGGLNPDNVTGAVRSVRPWAVDVSTGVEARDTAGRALRGIKDAARMAAFVRGVRDADV